MPEGERSDVRVENDFVSEGRLTKRTEIVRCVGIQNHVILPYNLKIVHFHVTLPYNLSLLDHLMFLHTQFT
jgi:hypothetical protein